MVRLFAEPTRITPFHFMPQTPHIENHFTAGEMVCDIVIGIFDGFTIPSRWDSAFISPNAAMRSITPQNEDARSV